MSAPELKKVVDEALDMILKKLEKKVPTPPAADASAKDKAEFETLTQEPCDFCCSRLWATGGVVKRVVGRVPIKKAPS